MKEVLYKCCNYTTAIFFESENLLLVQQNLVRAFWLYWSSFLWYGYSFPCAINLSFVCISLGFYKELKKKLLLGICFQPSLSSKSPPLTVFLPLSDGAFWNVDTYLLITFLLGLVCVGRETPHQYAFLNCTCITSIKGPHTAGYCCDLLVRDIIITLGTHSWASYATVLLFCLLLKLLIHAFVCRIITAPF